MARNTLPPRFVEIYSQKAPGYNKIIVDMATGVNYFWHYESEGYGVAGLTPLLNPNGTPVVTPPETIFPPK